MRQMRIRKKMVASMALFFGVLVALIAIGTHLFFREANERLILDQQYALVSGFAQELDRDIRSAQSMLEAIADSIPAEAQHDPAEAQRWLQAQSGARTVFARALVLLEPSGAVIAANVELPRERLPLLGAGEIFSRVVSEGKPGVSLPMRLMDTEPPVVAMAVPVRTQVGTVVAVLCGVVDLIAEEGIFAAVSNTRIGDSGYLYLYAQDRTMILHPDASRILRQDVLPGVNKLFDRALEGFEGSGVTVNSRGVPFLASFKRLATTGWILAANYRLADALEPVERFRNYFLLSMLLVLVVATALAWRIGSGLARPIECMAARFDDLARPDADRRQRLDASRGDELGSLAASFNTLLDAIQRSEESLQEAQSQVMQSERLAAVGQLAAGVAHEINNPIGFVKSNLGSLKTQVEQLLAVIESYRLADPVLSGHADLVARIEQTKSEADLDFVREDVVNVIEESLEGVSRVKKIVESLRDFARLDAAEWQRTNLEQGLESMLEVVGSEIKGKADIVREYGGLPEIECVAAQINQVFLSLLVNAAQAIETHGVVTLRTGFNAEQVWVEVIDTGSGIRPEVLARIFDPFFTTRPVGKGAGLGLTLAYGIVKRHGGRLEVASEPGKGATFRVVLPRVGCVGAA